MSSMGDILPAGMSCDPMVTSARAFLWQTLAYQTKSVVSENKKSITRLCQQPWGMHKYVEITDDRDEHENQYGGKMGPYFFSISGHINVL